jgi:hypothetical protein
MSDFTPEGREPYPDIYTDSKVLFAIGDMMLRKGQPVYIYDADYLELKTDQYGRFLQRVDIMPSHRERADRNLDGYIFELAWREGVYASTNKLEEETTSCEN